MIKLIVSLAGLFVAGVAWGANKTNNEHRNNKITYDEGKRANKKNEKKFLDLSGGVFGI